VQTPSRSIGHLAQARWRGHNALLYANTCVSISDDTTQILNYPPIFYGRASDIFQGEFFVAMGCAVTRTPELRGWPIANQKEISV